MKFNFDWTIRKWQAVLWITLGRRERAIDVYTDMLRDYPLDAYALGSMAHLNAELGNKSEAINLYELLVKQDNAPAYAWFNLGYLHQELEHPTQAEMAFRQALAINEQLDQAWYGLGLALIQQGRLDDAVHALERNTQLQPMSPYAWY